MILIKEYIASFKRKFPSRTNSPPWEITADLYQMVMALIGSLGEDFTIRDQIAIHKSAVVEPHAVIKGPAIISKNCFVASHVYLRGGIYLDENAIVGPGCEIKSSFIGSHSTLAHFNFAGDTLIGANVNIEAGAVIANHYNERDDKEIAVWIENHIHRTGSTKFGAVVGDHSRIGANAVLSPGTILSPRSVIRRLELVEQVQ